jgi:protein-L-isoaspartate O-methyltransferase
LPVTTLSSAPAPRRSIFAPRRVDRELLDDLPVDDPRAIQARRDLRLCNRLMLQPAIMARLLARHGGDGPRTMADIGTGDGTFALAVVRRLARRWPKVTVILVDRQNVVSEATLAGFAGLGWHAEPVSADVFDFFDRPRRYDVVTANLFLHHFATPCLSDLLARIALSAEAFVAGEPRRGPLLSFSRRFLGALGCNEVTTHDAAVSVRAGFRGEELSTLWPSDGKWTLSEHEAIPFTHCFAARRNGPGAAA